MTAAAIDNNSRPIKTPLTDSINMKMRQYNGHIIINKYDCKTMVVNNKSDFPCPCHIAS